MWETHLYDLPYKNLGANGPISPTTGLPCPPRNLPLPDKMFAHRYALNFVELSTATNQNNISPVNNFGDTEDTTYVSNTDGKYYNYVVALPRKDIGVTVSGSDIFPTKDRAAIIPEECTSASCTEHIGADGGMPHVHGDPFGKNCMYSQEDYKNSAGE